MSQALRDWCFISKKNLSRIIFAATMLLFHGAAFGAYNVTISNASSANGGWSNTSPDVWTPSGDQANLNIAEIIARLNNTTSVSITTSKNGTGEGDIFIDNAVRWAGDATLSLTAGRCVQIRADITVTGNTAGLVILPGSSGHYTLAGGRIIFTGSSPRLVIAGNDYTLIENVTALQNMNMKGYYALKNNIDATATKTWDSGQGFVPLGSTSAGQFAGVLDGLGNKIDGLCIKRAKSSNGYFGLFSFINREAKLLNLVLTNSDLTGISYDNNVGGLAGWNANGMIANCEIYGNVTGSAGNDNNAGGLAGWNARGTIADCKNHGKVTGSAGHDNKIGKLAGRNPGGTISGDGDGGCFIGTTGAGCSFAGVARLLLIALIGVGFVARRKRMKAEG